MKRVSIKDFQAMTKKQPITIASTACSFFSYMSLYIIFFNGEKEKNEI
jgi:hypothetical protein